MHHDAGPPYGFISFKCGSNSATSWFFLFSAPSSRTGMTVSRVTARACPSWALCRMRVLIPARRRCLTHPLRTSSLPISRRRTSRSLTTRARTRTPTWAIRTPWTPCTIASRAHGGRGSGKMPPGTGWRAPLCWRSHGPHCLSCPGWTHGGTTVAYGGPTSCCTPLTRDLIPLWATDCCMGYTVWRIFRWVKVHSWDLQCRQQC